MYHSIMNVLVREFIYLCMYSIFKIEYATQGGPILHYMKQIVSVGRGVGVYTPGRERYDVLEPVRGV